MTDDRTRLDGRRLVLRADATTEGGTGHMMRTLALAQAWIDAGGRGRWFVVGAPPALLERIGAEGIEVVRIAAPAGSREDAATLRAALFDDPGAVAVVDGTQFDDSYLAHLAETGRRVMLVDDTPGRAAYPVGLVLNQNAHADPADYPDDGSTRFLLGTRYVLLRREFGAAPPPRTIPQVARHLLVTFGGADPTGMTRRTVDGLRRLPATIRREVEVQLIVGSANADGTQIEAAAADPGLGFTAIVERAVTDMPARMAWADLAITSGGSTVWELARMGCPALVVETVPVERLLVAGLVKVGLFGHLGPGATLDDGRMAHAIAAKAKDRPWRTEMSALGMRLIDGAGARRVVDALAELNLSPKEQT